jgi:primosomal protein N' (replication factor Y)
VFVEVVVVGAALRDVGGDDALTYAVPAALAARIQRGIRVVVPLGTRKVTGVVTGIADVAPAGRTLKLVDEVLDDHAVVDDAQLDLVRFVSRYYAAPFSAALAHVLPPDTERAPRRRFRLTERGERARVFFASEGLQPADVAALSVIEPGELVDEAKLKRAGLSRARLAKLVDQGLFDELAATRPVTPPRTIESVVPLENGLPIPRAATALSAFDGWLRTFVEHEGHAPTLTEAEVAVGRAREKARKLAALGRVRIDAATRDPLRRVRLQGKAAAPHLTEPQQEAVDAIVTALRTGGGNFLLQGVTGSGKTEVYLRALSAALVDGRGVLLLVPEIGLTPQLVARIEAVVDEPIVVLHSALSEADRRDGLQLLREGRARVVVGARSAVFAPVKNLGLVIVDEEHDPSLKQDEHAPRYHARDVALWRAAHAGAVGVLGSATPSFESLHNASQGKLRTLSLPARVGGGGVLPLVELVDLRSRRDIAVARRKDRAVADDAGGVVLSSPLVTAMAETLAAGEQVLLFLNKRGWSSTITCDCCGLPRTCPQCSISLTLHRRGRRGAVLRCHLCGYAEPFAWRETGDPVPAMPTDARPTAVPSTGSLMLPEARADAMSPALAPVAARAAQTEQTAPATQAAGAVATSTGSGLPPCPACGEDGLVQLGTGTERVEAEVRARFPDARVVRLDRDVMTSHDEVVETLRRIQQREVDVIVGTQMVAKGHDWPAVRLVGIVLADVALSLPDFRAGERAMALLTQVAGRAGRGTERGRVIVQTYEPEHPALVHLVEHDVARFAAAELAARERLRYPPYARLVRFRIEHEDERTALDLIHDVASALSRAAEGATTWWKIGGPSPCPLERIAGRFRVHLLLFTADMPTRTLLLRAVGHDEDLRRRMERARARFVVDVDPAQLL